eukprot:Gb_27807 [translate_table: standard]
MIQEVFYVDSEVNIGDFIPYLEWMDLQGLRRRQKHIHKVFDDFFEKIIQEHVENKSRNHRDFVDVMLQLSEDNTMDIEITRDNIKAVILVCTSSTTLEWAMSELLLNPSMMKKAQDELQSVIGLNRMVEEYDLPQLEYLQVVAKETLRLHPPGPLLIPHEAREDCIVAGYNIPKKARIIVNFFAVGTDPNSWEDADWRRGCPGKPLGTTVDMLSAGTDTSSATLEWAMSELLLNPSMMKKAQDELQSVVGLNRMVEESDLPQLEYLQVVVKETLRLHPPGPLLIPHEAREDCVVAGYNIPKKARIIVNVFAVGTDPNSWEDADMFKPDMVGPMLIF